MPAILPSTSSAQSSTPKVLVTGASGFVATHLVQELLASGYIVIGTVRSVAKGEYLKRLYKEDERFSYVIVDDIGKPGAFDEAVKGVDAVVHTSSPFHFHADDPQELIGPAVQGTVGILESIKKNGSGVKRVVVTSSVAALWADKTPPYTFTEADWNVESSVIVERDGRAASTIHKYLLSKTLAERAAWDFIERNKSEIQWDLTTILPPMVYGPTIHEVKDIAALNTSVAYVYQEVTNPNPDEQTITQTTLNFVDVRDVAKAHALALEKEAAGGERFIVSNGLYSVQEFLNILNAAGVSGVPRGFPDAKIRNLGNEESGAKAARVLGLQYHPREQTIVDTITSIQQRFLSN